MPVRKILLSAIAIAWTVITPVLAADPSAVQWLSPDTTKAPPLPDYMRLQLTEAATWMDAHEIKALPDATGAALWMDAHEIKGPNWSWTGFYIGGQIGAARGTATFADPFGASIFGDNVTTPGFLAGGQIGFNLQVPNSSFVLGVEADANWLTSDGTNTCLAFSGFFVSATCHADPNAIGTLTARGGYAFGPTGGTLAYAKGGAAWIHENVDTTTNPGLIPGFPNLSTNSSFTQWGWTVGAGVEQAVSHGWTVFLEYDYLGFGSASVATPASIFQVGPFFFPTPPGTTNATQNIQEVKVGVNYNFGVDPGASWNGVGADTPYSNAVQAWLWGWDVVVGSRVWFSSGKFQWNVGAGPAGTNANSDVSRLTYDGLTGYTGEYFQRIDTPWGLFAKGNLGLGIINAGHENDEDWLVAPFGTLVEYSNTLSNTNNGTLGYATLDLGYDVLREAGTKVGPFVGYNYFTEKWETFGCTQIANPFSDCSPATGQFPSTTEVGTENSTWQSLRVGLNADTTFVERVKLSADLAYLPFVSMTGQDNHLLRGFTTSQQGTGQGVQLEAILSYFVTSNLSVGVGGRYWAMWTTSATSTPTGGVSQAAAFSTERYGVFLQADYRFGALPEGFR